MKIQATRNHARHEELIEITGCLLFLMLSISVLLFLYMFPWRLLN